MEAIASNRTEDPAVAAFVINTRDITERKEGQQLTYRAFHDPLTDLANRALFADRLEHALSRRARHDSALAVIFLDLDDFKDVNDSLGHAIGDELLAAVAARLRDCARAEDTVARLGGDEFAILVEDISNIENVTATADRVHSKLRPPFQIAGNEVVVSSSIGIALTPFGGETAEELLRNADIAMYTAKASGKGTHQVFEPSMHAALLDRLGLERDLQRAVERDEFELVYQPIVATDNGHVHGVEALLRWRHPERGLLPPSRFIGLGESTGAIGAIGRWVLETACRRAEPWARAAGGSFFLAVNLSPRQLHDPGLIDQVGEALQRSGLPAEQLVLEITESALVEHPSAATSLRGLKDLGLKLAVDDFGTGHSALHYLPSIADRHPQDRPRVHRRHDRGRAHGRRGRGDHPDVPQGRDHAGRRGRGATRAGACSGGDELPAGAGLPLRPARRPRAHRREARPGRPGHVPGERRRERLEPGPKRTRYVSPPGRSSVFVSTARWRMSRSARRSASESSSSAGGGSASARFSVSRRLAPSGVGAISFTRRS